jgi:hypothetical protein
LGLETEISSELSLSVPRRRDLLYSISQNSKSRPKKIIIFIQACFLLLAF